MGGEGGPSGEGGGPPPPTTIREFVSLRSQVKQGGGRGRLIFRTFRWEVGGGGGGGGAALTFKSLMYQTKWSQISP